MGQKTPEQIERDEKIRDGRLLEVLRVRTAMYIGERKLSTLYSFLNGWSFALQVYDVEFKHQLPKDFHDWVAYRLHFLESTSGYKNMILEHVPDESAALDRFFELVDEHYARKARVVARLPEYRGRDHIFRIGRDGTREKVACPPTLSPCNVSLISYTDNPGFFVEHDADDSTVWRSGSFFPVLEWFESRYGVARQSLEVLDLDTFNRWVKEDEQYETQRRARLDSTK